MSESKTLLRHLLSTMAYRLTKSLHEVEPEFYSFKPGNGARTPLEIIYHMSWLLTFTNAVIEKSQPEKPDAVTWEGEVKRFFDLLKDTDELIVDSELPLEIILKLIQGPISDVLTHIGQIAMIRRLYNKPVKGENFMKAKVEIGVLERENQELSDTKLL